MSCHSAHTVESLQRQQAVSIHSEVSHMGTSILFHLLETKGMNKKTHSALKCMISGEQRSGLITTSALDSLKFCQHRDLSCEKLCVRCINSYPKFAITIWPLCYHYQLAHFGFFKADSDIFYANYKHTRAEKALK